MHTCHSFNYCGRPLQSSSGPQSHFFPTYRIARRPNLFTQQTPGEIRQKLGASQFTSALLAFLRTESPTFDLVPPSFIESRRYGVYSHFRRTLLSLRGFTRGRDTFHDIVRAHPGTDHDASFSTVLYVSDPGSAQTLGVQGVSFSCYSPVASSDVY